MIGANELRQLTGATPRQIDYWCRMNVIQTLGEPNPGSGHNRQFSEANIPRVKVLVDVSKAFDGQIEVKMLKHIYDHFDLGFVSLGDGLLLSWAY